jgi:DNA-binding PadR family transcriptional regulator
MEGAGMMLRSDRVSMQMRREMVLALVRDHPWSTSRMLCDALLAATGGAPTIATGAIHLPPHRMYPILRDLEGRGLVQRRQFTSRTILWSLTAEEATA